MEQYINLIEFESANPETIIQMWRPEFEMKEFIEGSKAQLQYSKDQGQSIFDEMFIFVFLGGVLAVLVILAFLL